MNSLRLVGRVSDDAQRMDAVAHQRRDRRIDHPMPFELRAAGKSGGHQRHPKMATFPRPRMSGMAGAVIDHVEGQRRECLLEGGADLAGGGGARNGFLVALKGRVS